MFNSKAINPRSASKPVPRPVVPEVTHLQFLVLQLLLTGGKSSGLSLREALQAKGVKKSGPAFYQLMGRLEEAKLVAGIYETKRLGGQTIKERVYNLTGDGRRAWHDVRDFVNQGSPAGYVVANE